MLIKQVRNDDEAIKALQMILRSVNPAKCRSEIGRAMEKRNQFPDVLPYDYNRVILRKLPGDKNSHYANASYVNVSLNEFFFLFMIALILQGILNLKSKLLVEL